MPTLEITTMIGCPLRCTFCPQDALKDAYGHGDKSLSLANFRIILDKVPRHVRIDFSGMAEPWANPSATDMLEHALIRGFQVAVYTTLSGMSMNDATRVIGFMDRYGTQFEEVVIHVPDASGNMRGWRNSDEYGRVLDRFVALQQRGPHRSRRVYVMTMDASDRVHQDLHLRHRGVRFERWEGHSRAGSLDPAMAERVGAQSARHHECAVSCASTPFYDQNVLLPNGDVVLCCMDYSLKHTIGNLLRQDYSDLFLSPQLTRLRADNARPEFSKCSICKSCHNVVTYRLEPGAMWIPDDAGQDLGHVVRAYLPRSLRRVMRRLLRRVVGSEASVPMRLL